MFEQQSNFSKQGYHHIAKLLMIGNCSVGKTNILINFIQHKFTQNHMTTIGIDYKFKTIQIQQKQLRLQIWDTAGQQRFRTITRTYYKSSMGIIVVFSVTDRLSFQSVDEWIKQIRVYASEQVCICLVGNKIDCSPQQRKVSESQGRKKANEYGIKYLECSAKNNENIDEIFYCIGKMIKKKLQRKSSILQRINSIKLLDIIKDHNIKKRKCCQNN